MSYQTIQNGIAAIQAGDFQKGANLLRGALMNASITGTLRAIALIWLAETSTDTHYKLQCYQMAVQADPSNQEAQNRFNALASAQMQMPPQIPTPPPSKNQPQSQSGQIPRPPLHNLPGTGPLKAQNANQQKPPQLWDFGVRGGPNGVGTAFMVVRDGLLATTRFVVGQQTNVTLITQDGREFPGEVVRSYTPYDLAFIRTKFINVPYLREITPLSNVPAETPLLAKDFIANTVRAACRNTKRTVSPGWFPTTFDKTLPRSFNGAPLIDSKEDLVGMLTRNTSRTSGYLFGLHISLIRRKIEEFYNEIQTDPNRIYCGTCGSLSKAGADGLYYCEVCGALFPFAQKLHRTPHPRSGLYYDKDRAD